MRRLVAVVATMLVLVGICGAATSLFGDRELFTSPPDAIAEEFYRQVVTHRFDRAVPLLAQPVDPGTLRPLATGIQSRLGHVGDISADIASRTGAEALVTVQLRSKEGSEAIPVSLRFERGEWKLIQSPNAGSR